MAMYTNPNGKQPAIKRDYGPLYESNIEELLRKSKMPGYSAPKFPVPLPCFTEYENKANIPTFGKAMREKHFYLEDTSIYLNHGAFGSILKEALLTQQALECYVERQPVRFIAKEVFPFVAETQKRLADFVGCDPTDMAIIENVTIGMTTVLNSLKLGADDTIFHLNTVYAAVRKSIEQVQSKTNVKLQEEKIMFPINGKEEILDLVKETLKPGTALAMFDHISSEHSLIMPIKELVQICHDKGVPVLVDGAHALGATNLNVPDTGADYYVSNAHKWFCGPKGCAFVYVKPHLQANITALVASHGYGNGFQSELTFTGLKDYTPYLALQCSINFWNSIGPDLIRLKVNKLLRQAVGLLIEKWDGKLLAPLEMHAMMCCVSLPEKLYKGKNVTFKMIEMIQNILFHEHSIEVPIKCIQNKLYVRISVYVYNEIEEYEKLADAVLGMLDLFD